MWGPGFGGGGGGILFVESAWFRRYIAEILCGLVQPKLLMGETQKAEGIIVIVPPAHFTSRKTKTPNMEATCEEKVYGRAQPRSWVSDSKPSP